MDLEDIQDEIDQLNNILSLILNHIYKLELYIKINKNNIEDGE